LESRFRAFFKEFDMSLCCCSDSFLSSSICKRFKIFGYAVVLLMAGALCAWASTGYPNEISNISIENVTPTSADIVWDTVHLSTSQVVLARDTNYAGERRVGVSSAAMVNHHRVRVDHLMPYDPVEAKGTYYFYVASTDVQGTTSTAPGPYYASDPSSVLLLLQTTPPDPNNKSNYVIYTLGPTNVYAGSDLYFAVRIAQLAGNHPKIYVHNQRGYNNGSDGVVKAAIKTTARGLEPQTISVHLACNEYNPNNSDDFDQYYDAGKNLGFCWENQYDQMTVRLRTSAKTPRGNYTVTISLQDNGQDVSSTYYFSVLSAPTEPRRRDTYPPPIPGQDMWESYMTQLGHKYCDDGNYAGSRDRLNAAGNFLVSFGAQNQADAWYYDGGRVYQQISSYTNDPRWNHCALTILDPYRQWILANNGKLPLYAIFPYGMAMNYWRTGERANLDAIMVMESVPFGAQVGGQVAPDCTRSTAYSADVRIAYELVTGKRDRLLAKNIDKLLGHLDMLYYGRVGSVHPFMVGLAMEAAIHYYDMTVAEGHPDYRVPEVVKRALDALWRDYYVPRTHSFRQTLWDVPTIDDSYVLNALVAPAYAWYWNLTGDDVSLERGDDLFQHTFDRPDEFRSSGKQFSQIYKWSFDFVRWRSGIASSTTVQDNNPFAGPYPDTEPPIETQVASSVTDTTATFTWKTYENADSQVIYGMTGGNYPLKSAQLDTGGGVTSHTVTVTGLTPGTTYHYRVNSRDAAENLASLADATFTTAGSGQDGGGGTITGSGDETSGTQGASDNSGNVDNTSTSGGTSGITSGSSASSESHTTGDSASSENAPSAEQSGVAGSQGSSKTFSPKQMLMQ
jgi:hypothetical protein